jgi:hypothetical protein
MVFNTTFNNISVVSWLSFLLGEETSVPGQNHWLATSHRQTLSHNDVMIYVSIWTSLCDESISAEFFFRKCSKSGYKNNSINTEVNQTKRTKVQTNYLIIWINIREHSYYMNKH